MSITKKLTIAVIALSLVLVGVVGGTLAFLVAESNEVTNTFTYGEIEISLWETDLDGNKTESGVTYPRIIPGETVTKDPTVTVKAKSENCYVYVMITNNVVLKDQAVASYGANSGWTHVETEGTTSLYRYDTIIKYSNQDQDTSSSVFSKLTFDEALTVEDIKTLTENSEARIIVKAYAHQSANTDQNTADAAAIAWAFPAQTPET